MTPPRGRAISSSMLRRFAVDAVADGDAVEIADDVAAMRRSARRAAAPGSAVPHLPDQLGVPERGESARPSRRPSRRPTAPSPRAKPPAPYDAVVGDLCDAARSPASRAAVSLVEFVALAAASALHDGRASRGSSSIAPCPAIEDAKRSSRYSHVGRTSSQSSAQPATNSDTALSAMPNAGSRSAVVMRTRASSQSRRRRGADRSAQRVGVLVEDDGRLVGSRPRRAIEAIRDHGDARPQRVRRLTAVTAASAREPRRARRCCAALGTGPRADERDEIADRVDARPSPSRPPMPGSVIRGSRPAARIRVATARRRSASTSTDRSSPTPR